MATPASNFDVGVFKVNTYRNWEWSVGVGQHGNDRYIPVDLQRNFSKDADEAQGESLENQTTYYKQLIENNPEYDFAGIFADYGLTGTKDDRPEFQKMLTMAREHKIDRILTKSISRFARSTTIILEVVRELKSLNVEVIFPALPGIRSTA